MWYLLMNRGSTVEWQAAKLFKMGIELILLSKSVIYVTIDENRYNSSSSSLTWSVVYVNKKVK